MSLEGKVAIVTGAAAGLGRNIAQHYGRAGVQVVVSDINDDKGEETVALITDAGGTAAYTHTDSSSLDENQALVKFAVDTYGNLDIAVNNAGVAPPSTPLADVDADLWNKIININLNGVFWGINPRSPRCATTGAARS